MSKLDELIHEYCPDGVRYEELGDLLGRVDGSNKKIVKSKIQSEGRYPVYTQGGNQKPDGFSDEKDAVITDVPVILYGDHTNVLKWIGHDFIAGADGVKLVKSSVDSGLDDRFLYHCLRDKIKEIPNGYARHFARLRKLTIPIPPFEVQKEIVNILDKFIQLEAELEAELEARRKQYEYYRNHLLTFDEPSDGIRWASLSDVTLPTKNMKWKETDGGIFKYIDLSSVSRENHSIIETTEIDSTTAPSRAQKLVENGDIIFATTRPTLQRYTLINAQYNGQVASTGYCVLRPNRDMVTSKWIYHNIAKSDFNNFVEKHQEGSAYPSISDSKVKAYTIPVPPISEQERIVSLLDKFEKLVNDISSGLPAEIEGRHQQYEYYRTKLLTFQELAA